MAGSEVDIIAFLSLQPRVADVSNIRGPDRSTTLNPVQPQLPHDKKPSSDWAPSMRANALPAWEPIHAPSNIVKPASLDHTVQHGAEAPGRL
eukprot:13687402-Alexandrium_andersonii.AAC.1